ncbi:SHOCT domain-containing protein, partial [Rhodococcus sp. ENV425]
PSRPNKVLLAAVVRNRTPCTDLGAVPVEGGGSAAAFFNEPSSKTYLHHGVRRRGSASGFEEGATMMWQWGAMGWVGWLLMALVMVGFWALVVFGIAAVFRPERRIGTGSEPHGDDPARLLDARFVRGEIDVEEYRARLKALRSTR